MKTSKQLITFGLLLAGATASAQEFRSSSSLFLLPQSKADVTVPFSIYDTGTSFPVKWGMDVAWMNEQNMRKGINYIGRNNLSIARSSFQMNEPLIGDTELTANQISALKERTRLIDLISYDVDIVLNADQGDGTNKFIVPYYSSNNRANTDHWARLINASVAWMQTNYPRHKVVAVSPFNEPDYIYWNEGTLANFKEIARLLKEDYPRFKDIAITAGNTLNNDEASKWYNGVKPYATWGNTHQLAGSFTNFANFWQEVVKDGNYAYADELHNVGEAMIAANYGMKTGIWWGFDSRARGEFCQISNDGVRIAYAENRPGWTATSIYRNDNTGRVLGFIGGSERQASTSSYLYLSKDREVYIDGYGPLKAYRMEYPGGTGYQKGQTNAERMFVVTDGEDVERTPITAGQYKIMNKASKGLVSHTGGDQILQMWYAPDTKPQNRDLWTVAPVSERNGGDYSFHTLTNVASSMHINVLNNSTKTGDRVIAYNANNASNEQWAIEYAGDGYYYLRNRESGLYLTTRNGRPRSNIIIDQQTKLTGDNRDKQLWRLLPADAPTEGDAPDAPTGLSAQGQSASVKLSWTASTSADAASYTVLRAQADGTGWNTIARGITTTSYTDNTCRQGETYIYKVQAVDRSLNASAPSATATAAPTAVKTMVAGWQFEGSLNDDTENMMDAGSLAETTYQDDSQVGSKALKLNGTNWLQLPYEVADMDEMTIALWAKWTNSTRTWTRLFDFGNGTEQYLFLTPSNGSNMRFAIKDGGEEQIVETKSKLPARQWHHIAVTIGRGTVTIWLDGEKAGEAEGITIKPSDIRPVLNFVGRSQYNADPIFAGAIDDMRIYNYPLTQEELKSIIATPTGIDRTDGQKTGNDTPSYDLGGRRVTSNYKGIVIQQGKKTLKR